MLLPVSHFLKPAPGLMPLSLWLWCARRFFFVDARGDEQLKNAPRLIPFRLWRFLAKRVFILDVYKHRAFQQSAPGALKETLRIAPDAWLFAGTLLGCVRDGRIIAWDRDIDLGIPSERVTEELLDRFRAAGFRVERVYRYDLPAYRDYLPDAMGQCRKVVLRSKAKIELYCFVRGKDGRLYYGQGKQKLFTIDYDLVYPQKQIPFYDFMANVPERVDDHLVYMYGDDWRIPKPHWIRSAEHEECRERFFIKLGDGHELQE